MPNIGKPSQDCHLCRARRVKRADAVAPPLQCDLAKPGCVRCINYGATCPGYRQESDFLFRNQDAGSVERKQRKKAAKAALKAQAAEVPLEDSGTPGAIAKQRRSPPTGAGSFQLAPSLELSYLQSKPAVMLVFRLFSEGGARSFGRLDFLPNLLEETRETSCLALTADLFVAAQRSRVPNAPPSKVPITDLYGRSLMSIRGALAHASKRLEDETVVAVWLLSLHEAISSASNTTKLSSPSPWDVHSEGIIGILRARGNSQFASEQGRRIFWVCFSIIQLRCMVHNLEFPPEIQKWLRVIKSNQSAPERLRHAIAVYNVESCAVIAQIVRVVCDGDPVDACLAYPDILKRVTALEMAGPDTSPDLTPGSSPESTPEPEEYSEAPDQPRLQVDNLHRSSRLKLHCWTVLLSNFIINHARQDAYVDLMCDLPLIYQQRSASIQTAQRLATYIIRLTGPVLKLSQAQTSKPSGSWVNGLRMVWPLLVIERFRAMLPEQARVAEQFLERIGQHMGISEAKKRYDHPENLPPEAEWEPDEEDAYAYM
ncbi:hypothetical protein GQ53DRAFT_821430 [Thozetella sp. PMI_491]|nr:hypothetical protein GQ53DRAFT_821430 [Thozetella sp. PMI_491]